jgi:hypothetical protein
MQRESGSFDGQVGISSECENIFGQGFAWFPSMSALELRLSMFQSLTGVTATQIQPDLNLIDTAFDMISSY